jgi:hypothetical protein
MIWNKRAHAPKKRPRARGFYQRRLFSFWSTMFSKALPAFWYKKIEKNIFSKKVVGCPWIHQITFCFSITIVPVCTPLLHNITLTWYSSYIISVVWGNPHFLYYVCVFLSFTFFRSVLSPFFLFLILLYNVMFCVIWTELDDEVVEWTSYTDESGNSV